MISRRIPGEQHYRGLIKRRLTVQAASIAEVYCTAFTQMFAQNYNVQSNVTYPDATYPSTTDIRQRGVLNIFDSHNLIVMPLIALFAHISMYLNTNYTVPYNVGRHACNKVAFRLAVRNTRTCKTMPVHVHVKLCQYMLLYIISCIKICTEKEI